jgi:hypothetical protein
MITITLISKYNTLVILDLSSWKKLLNEKCLTVYHIACVHKTIVLKLSGQFRNMFFAIVHFYTCFVFRGSKVLFWKPNASLKPRIIRISSNVTV